MVKAAYAEQFQRPKQAWAVLIVQWIAVEKSRSRSSADERWRDDDGDVVDEFRSDQGPIHCPTGRAAADPGGLTPGAS
jgi:hypothetical protein